MNQQTLLLLSFVINVFLLVGISYAHCYDSSVSPASGDTSATFRFCGSANVAPTLYIDGTSRGSMTKASTGECTDLTGTEYKFALAASGLADGSHSYKILTGHGDCTGTFEIIPAVKLAEISGFEGSFPPSGWITGGDSNWLQDSSTKFGGSYSAASGSIDNSQSTYIKTTKEFIEDGKIKFYWKVSSERSYDFLVFCIDSKDCTRTSGFRDRISGDVAWEQKSYPVAAGTHTFEWRYATDYSILSKSNRGWIDNVEFIGTSVSDTVPPSTAASATSPPDGAPYAFGELRNTDVKVALTCLDTSGCSSTKYCTDTTPATPCSPGTTYSSPFTISSAGTTYVRYTSTDNIGNIESTKTVTVIIDKTPPTILDLFNKNPQGYITRTAVTLEVWTSSDPGSTCKYSTTSGQTYDDMPDMLTTSGGVQHSKSLTGLAQGMHNYYIRCKDRAGNANTNDYIISFIVDTLKPTASINSLDNGTNYKETTMPAIFTGMTKDSTDGAGLQANSVTFYIRRESDSKYWIGNSWSSTLTWLPTIHSETTSDTETTWTDNIDLPRWDDGTYYLKLKAVDKAGNSFESQISFVYDSTQPTIASLSHSPQAPPPITPETDVTIRMEASDTRLSNIEIYVDAQLGKTCTESPCLYTSRYAGGDHNYYGKVTDRAGNELSSPTNSFTVIIPEVITLKKGWNLISIPYQQFYFVSSTCESGKNFYNYNSDTMIFDVIGQVEGMGGEKGYWINSDKPCEIKFIGEEKYEIESKDIKLQSGWNQISSPVSEPDFKSVERGGCTLNTISYYSTETDKWENLDQSSTFEKYKGYFVNADCHSGAK